MAGGEGTPPDAGSAVLRALTAIGADLDATLGLALLDRPDGVHAHRKIVRRLRSTLAAYRPFFDDAAVRWLHDAYRTWGRELGEARDLEVRIATAQRWDASSELLDPLRSERRRALQRLARQGVTVAARERREVLAAFLDDPPRTPKAARRTKRGVRRRLAKEGDRVLRRAAHATASPGDEIALHDLRKAARRLRYAVEAVTRPPVGLFGAKAARLAGAAERVHDLLGDYRDAAGLAAYVDDLGTDPVLVTRASAQASECLAALPDALDALRDALDRFR